MPLGENRYPRLTRLRPGTLGMPESITVTMIVDLVWSAFLGMSITTPRRKKIPPSGPTVIGPSPASPPVSIGGGQPVSAARRKSVVASLEGCIGKRSVLRPRWVHNMGRRVGRQSLQGSTGRLATVKGVNMRRLGTMLVLLAPL